MRIELKNKTETQLISVNDLFNFILEGSLSKYLYFDNEKFNYGKYWLDDGSYQIGYIGEKSKSLIQFEVVKHNYTFVDKVLEYPVETGEKIAGDLSSITCKELKELLNKVPDDAEIILINAEFTDPSEICSIYYNDKYNFVSLYEFNYEDMPERYGKKIYENE